MITFVHIADIHLGLSLKSVKYPLELAKERRQAIWDTFKRVIDYTIENKIDFLLIAGDLYEEEYFTLGDINRVKELFEYAEGVNILISTGNHDYIHKNSLYKQVRWPENVHIFTSDGINKKEYKNLDTVVYGYSWDKVEIKDDQILDKDLEKSDCKNKIMLIHADVLSKSSYLPTTLEKLSSKNMTYIGLGHIHKGQIFNGNIAYPGVLEPTSFKEEGEKGFILGKIDKDLTLNFKAFSKKMFKIVDIDINENMGYLDIINEFSLLKEKERTFYRVKLNGYIQNNIDKEALITDISNKFHYIEIEDKTIPDYDIEALENDYKDGLLGEFIKNMKNNDLEDEIVKDALYLGLEALLKERVNR